MIELRFDGPVNYSQFNRSEVRKAFRKAGAAVAKKLKASINRRSGGGEVYRYKGKTYRASAPGNPPVRLTGNLFRSVKGRASRRGYALVVQALAPHAHLMELGSVRMARRPAFASAFIEARSIVNDLLVAAVGDGLTVTAGQPDSPPKEVETG